MEKDQLLKTVGLKITGPRVKILQMLEQAVPRHLSAEAIYKKLVDLGDEIGLATVYRVLTQFEQHGLVARHHFDGGYCVFELVQGEHHDHLVCTRCGAVTEFTDPFIEKQQTLIADAVQFKMTTHVLTLYGICMVCQHAT